MLWLGRAVEDLPGEVTTIAEVEAEVARMRVTDVAAGTTLGDVTADGVQRDWAEEVARRLAPVRDAAARERDSVPVGVPLLELLGIARRLARRAGRRMARAPPTGSPRPSAARATACSRSTPPAPTGCAA